MDVEDIEKKEEKTEAIKVGVRVRPVLPNEIGKENVVFLGEDNQSIRIEYGNHYIDCQFDKVYNEQSQQEDVFNFVEDEIKHVLKGYNCTVLAFGQTGSGKTYTMFGSSQESVKRQKKVNPKNQGIIPRGISTIFDGIQEIQQKGKGNFTVYCSFIQIYNEKIFDLLEDEQRSQNLAIREDLTQGIFVEGLSEYVVQSSRECLILIKRGNRNRAVRQTRYNANSSRSHSIFQLTLEQENENERGNLKRAKINLCDLAGSEQYDKENKMEGNHLTEMIKINLSLTNLGKVISQLAKGQKNCYIPFRDSKLTRLLQNSLSGNCKTIIISTIAPIANFVEESINTLKFADRAKHVMMRVKKNEIDASSNLTIKNLQKEIGHLKSLINYQKKGKQNEVKWTLMQLKEENQRLRTLAQISPEDVKNLQKENQNLKMELQKMSLQSPEIKQSNYTQEVQIRVQQDTDLQSNQQKQQTGFKRQKTKLR